jgi:hypothetical protein
MTKLQLPLKNKSQRKRQIHHLKKCQKIPQLRLRMTKVNKVQMTNNRLLSLARPPLMIKIIKIMIHKINSRMIKMTNS